MADSPDRPGSIPEDPNCSGWCAMCGARIDPGKWHPVVVPGWTDRVFAFCGPECRDEWRSRLPG